MTRLTRVPACELEGHTLRDMSGEIERSESCTLNLLLEVSVMWHDTVIDFPAIELVQESEALEAMADEFEEVTTVESVNDLITTLARVDEDATRDHRLPPPDLAADDTRVTHRADWV